MKYGLLYYKDTDNIGDDIQSYAASKFLPRIDYLIDRENIEGFVPKKDEYVATIMNAWYVHDKYNFNMSPFIYPLYTSMFFKKFIPDKGVDVGFDYINSSIINSLKNYGPVGCRDLHTEKTLTELGVKVYFSGCMTLTLDKFNDIKKENYIVTVGLTDEEYEFIKNKTNRPVKKFIQDVKRGSFSEETWKQRKDRVEEVLKLYQGAHMVVTTKLHCALPCLALGTPVLLLYDDSFSENKDRLGTYLKYLNYINRKELKKAEINFEKPAKNKKDYLELRNNLIKSCNSFIESSKDINLKPPVSIKYYKQMIEEQKQCRGIIINHLEKLQLEYVKKCNTLIKLKEKNKKIKSEYEAEYKYISSEYANLLEKYNSIIYSRTYKIIKKINEIRRFKNEK